ncbi:MAG: hypothetical protein UGF89_09020 [Acutalibacteraceae bacterium]|nr:hypothetical protein [Acutalibacteraceae bacterium]
MLETIFEIAITILFIWLFFKALKLTFKITWGLTKILAIVLFVIALPALIGCLIFAGGAILLLPLALIGLAFGLVKKCAV